jgi:hypothetical protein
MQLSSLWGGEIAHGFIGYDGAEMPLQFRLRGFAPLAEIEGLVVREFEIVALENDLHVSTWIVNLYLCS